MEVVVLRRAVPLVLAALLGPSLLVTTPMPGRAVVSPLTSQLVASFDSAAADWFNVNGATTIADTASPRTQGSGALRISYNFGVASQGRIGARRTATTPELPGLPRRLSLDVAGDGTWNVVYLQVRDATGEIFHYAVGNLHYSGWKTMSVDLGTAAPAATFSGNGDGKLDLPVQVYRIVVDHNPGESILAGSVVVDNLVYQYEDWSPLRADMPVFVPSAGQATKIRVGPVEPGVVSVGLRDEAGRVRTVSGTAAGAGADLVFPWTGTSDASALMTGSVRATMTITRGSTSWSYGIPYLVGLPSRYENLLPGSIVGINSTLTTIATADRAVAESQARLMEGAWIRRARESFNWNQLEPRQGWYEWAPFDQAVEIADAHHVEITGTLEYSASWASSAPASAAASARQFYPPSTPADFAAYARAVVHRYKDRIHTWEIWNEENSSTFWKPAPSASAYAALLKAAYAAIKTEDPSATVLLGGTVGFDRAYIDGVFAAGAWASFDALAIHTYVGPQPETSMIPTWLDNARAYLDTKGSKPLWVTEFGWSTYTGSGTSYVGVSESAQAAYTARAYLLMARQGVAGVFAYELMEHGTSTTSRLDNYGLVEQSGRLKPAYGALRRVAEALDLGTTLGIADPLAASRTTVASLDSISGWSVASLGGGWAKISQSTARHSGTGSMRLDYSFGTSTTGVELRRNLAVSGTPSTISVWVYGDASANPVYVKVADRTGETFQGAVGTLQKGWQRLVLYGDGADINWTHSGGDNDGVIDYPITLKSIFVFRGGIGKTSGVAYFDDIQVDTGPRVRGVVISRRSGDNQALYTLGPATTASVPVTGDRAWRVDGPTSTSLTVTGGAVSVALGALPVNILSAAGLSPTTITPNGDGVDDTATLTWVAGDPTRYTFQVISVLTGQVVRNVAVNALCDAGVRGVTWDGKLGGSPAPPGRYLMRLANLGPDGRVSYLIRTVSVN
jgi:hypothetical protein